MRKLAVVGALLAAGVMAAMPASFAWVDEVDAAFLRFWNAGNPAEADAAAAVVLDSGVTFDEALSRLKQGRPYASGVPRGLVGRQRRSNGLVYWYNIEVPENYDPAKRYQVRVQLHGGVMRNSATPRGAGNIGSLSGAEQIYVIPFGWRLAPWWSSRQEENLAAILDSVKRTYNVDENRIALSGVSDGATAAYYFAMRQTTPFSSFLPLNGNVMVLANERLVTEELFPNNLLNKPFFAVNGGRDRLYPAAQVGPALEHLQKRGVEVTSLVQPDGEHNTAWWPVVKESFEEFVRRHPRNPHPDRLTWETERPDVHNRASWLIIDSILARDAQPPLPDVNEFARGLVMTFGVIGSGTRVSVIQPRSNAQRLGLRPGDVIVAVNDRAVSRATELEDLLTGLRPGDRLLIVVARAAGRAELRGLFQPDPPSGPDAVPGIVMFPRTQPSGRVDLVRVDNTVTARTRGVASFTLLLSPDAFDLSRPVRVVVNGRVAFEGRVERSLATLMKWAARDNDRTMLFGAELQVKVN